MRPGGGTRHSHGPRGDHHAIDADASTRDSPSRPARRNAAGGSPLIQTSVRASCDYQRGSTRRRKSSLTLNLPRSLTSSPFQRYPALKLKRQRPRNRKSCKLHHQRTPQKLPLKPSPRPHRHQPRRPPFRRLPSPMQSWRHQNRCSAAVGPNSLLHHRDRQRARHHRRHSRSGRARRLPQRRTARPTVQRNAAIKPAADARQAPDNEPPKRRLPARQVQRRPVQRQATRKPPARRPAPQIQPTGAGTGTPANKPPKNDG